MIGLLRKMQRRMLAIAYRDVDVPSQSDATHLDQEALEQNLTLQAMVGIQVSCCLLFILYCCDEF